LQKRLVKRGVRVDASMPLGIETAHFSPALRDESLRARLLAQCDLPPDGHLLLGIGRHHAEKRWPVVIDAVERAGARLPVGLILLGAGVERRAIARRIADSPHIRTFRPVYERAQFARIVASCDALIHGSEAEPFGLVAAEAMASGLPLIVPDEGGCAEIADPLTAELYTARDAQSAAVAIGRLFARDEKLLRRAAILAAAKVRTDREHTIDLMDYYGDLVAVKRGGRAVNAA
jgi:alpha-1,6-mannosyltransferase